MVRCPGARAIPPSAGLVVTRHWHWHWHWHSHWNHSFFFFLCIWNCHRSIIDTDACFIPRFIPVLPCLLSAEDLPLHLSLFSSSLSLSLFISPVSISSPSLLYQFISFSLSTLYTLSSRSLPSCLFRSFPFLPSSRFQPLAPPATRQQPRTCKEKKKKIKQTKHRGHLLILMLVLACWIA